MDDRHFFYRQNEYRYSFCKILCGKIEETQFKFVAGKFGNDRNLGFDCNFDAGQYLIFIEMDWLQQIFKELVVSSYGQFDISFEYVKDLDPLEIQKQLLKSFAQTNPPNQKYNNYGEKLGQQSIFKCSHYEFGIFYIYYVNQSQDQYLREKITFTQLDGLQLVPATAAPNQQDVTIYLPPREELMVIYKFADFVDGKV